MSCKRNTVTHYWHRFGVASALGFMLGVMFSLFAGLVTLVTGVSLMEEFGISLTSAVTLYMCAGILAGFIAGALNPLARSRLGFVIVGIVASLPLSTGGALLLFGRFWDRGESLFAFLFTTIVFGAIIGVTFHDSLNDIQIQQGRHNNKR